MKEYTTDRGTHLYYRVFYDIGGYNWFTSKETPRGYYLEIRRQPHMMAAFSSLTDPQGAIKYCLLKVKRQSNKQKQLAEALRIIAEHKAKEANAELRHAQKLRDDYREEGNEEQEKFWEAAAGRALSKWAAYNDMAESIALYL